MLQTPPHRFAEARFKRLRGLPAEFARGFGRIHRVAAVVAGAVVHEGDEAAGVAAELWGEFIHEIAESLHESEIGPFVAAADAVGLAGVATQEGLPKGLGVVANVKPVAHVQAIAIDGEGLAGGGAGDDQWDEFLWELTRAVSVGSVRNDGVESVGLVVTADE